MRSTAPQASSRANKSAVELACAKASIWLAWLPIDSKKNSGPGCVVTRFTNHASLGITHEMALGLTPVFSNHRPTSIAVLPAPKMTKCLGRLLAAVPAPDPTPAPTDARVPSEASAFGGTKRTPSPTLNLGWCVDGTDGL